MNTPRTFDTMDSMRGLLSMVVVLMHMHIEQTLQPYALARSAYLGVDCFFVMSGFVLAHAYDSRFAEGLPAWRFVVARWVRLFPLLLLATLVSVIVQVARNMGAAGDAAVPLTPRLFVMALAQCFLLPMPVENDSVAFALNIPAWSLSAELAANIVFAVFWRPLRRHLTIVLAFLGALLVVLIVQNGDADMGVDMVEYPRGLVRGLYGFFAGVWIRRRWPGDSYRESRWLSLTMTPLMFALMALKLPGVWACVYDAALCLLVLPLILALSARVEARAPERVLFRRLGATCYGIYVLHYPLGGALRWLVPYVDRDPLRWVALAAIVVGLPLVVDVLVRHVDTPMRRAVTRLLGLGGSTKPATQALAKPHDATATG